MCERKHLAGAVLSLSLLAGPLAADSVRLVSKVTPGLSSATADRESVTYMLFPWAVYTPPPSGSRLSAEGRFAVFSSHAVRPYDGHHDSGEPCRRGVILDVMGYFE